MNTHEILIAAKALIDTPEKWVQANYATDRNGKSCMPCESKAVSFCSLGALHCVSTNIGDVNNAITAIENALPDKLGIIYFNDSRTHAEVMAAFDRAIEETGKTS